MAIQPDNDATRESSWLPYGIAALKISFVLSLFRIFAPSFSEEMLGIEGVPYPTWEWVLFSITPVMLVCLSRSPANWLTLRGEIDLVWWALGYNLAYAIIFALTMGSEILWVAVLLSSIGAAMVMYSNHRNTRGAEE
ncbi:MULTISPECIES: hypothetical protein [unclassified Streptomyces]|uniref:hypothetical protein n=1 Tax=unclassified Streptomyces TaxID=2593676 RepID=UPI0019054B62|nr:hypothetical protein [Streptomyces sp. HSG2]